MIVLVLISMIVISTMTIGNTDARKMVLILAPIILMW